MMVDLQKKYNWVLNTVSYDSGKDLDENFEAFDH